MKRWLGLGIPIVALLALVGWKIATKESTAAAQAKDQKSRVNAPSNDEVATAGPRDILAGIDLVGTVESPNSAKLSPKTAGRIDFLQVREGDAVKAGEVLVRIDPTEVQGQIVQADGDVAAAKYKLAQAKITQGATDTGVVTQIRTMMAGVNTATADFNQTVGNFDATVATAQSGVTDATAKVAAAQSAVNSAQADLESAQANQANTAAKLSRVLTLYKQNYIAAQDVDDAKTADKVAQAGVNSANQKLAGAKSAKNSAEAELKASENQLSIAKRSGQAGIADAKAKLDQSHAGLDLAQSNRSLTPAYKENLAALQAAVDAAEGELHQAQARLSDTDLVSPIDGTVTARALDPGAIATPGQPVVTVDFLKWLYVTASVPIEESPNVHVGQEAQVVFDALPGASFSGVISKLNPSADPSSRQFTVYVALQNAQQRIRPGMYGRLKVVTNRTHAAVVVPLEAVRTEGTSKVVYVVDEQSIARRKEVTLGASDALGYQILSGIAAGDRVVTLSYAAPKDGQKIRTNARSKS